MKGTKPTKILVGGDRTAAKRFIGPANSQMEILKKQMSFQNRSQGVRRVWLHDDVYVECIKCFNYQENRIWVRPVVPEAEEEERESRYFLVLFSTGSGNEAVVWDLSADSVFVEKKAFSEIQAKFEEEGLPPLIEAEYPGSDSHTWNVNPPNDEHDSPLILPNYLYGDYGSSVGYEHIFTTHYPSSFTYTGLGVLDTVSWDFDYVDSSPLPYPNKSVLVDTDPGGEDDEKSSYINLFQGRVDESSPLVSEYESLTGQPWPEGYDVWRYIHFWHPFFWYSIKDEQASYERLSSYGRGVQTVDSWEHGQWDSDGNLVKQPLAWHNAGIAARTDTDEPEVLLFEYVSVCHEFVDTYGTGMCDTDLSTLDQYLRIYEHGKTPLSSLRQGVLDGTNAYRSDAGAHDLVFNSLLSESAQRHADDLVKTESGSGVVLDHVGNDGSTFHERIDDTGYFLWIDKDLWGTKTGENIASTNDDDPVTHALVLWEGSPGHYANMIDEDFSEMGVGVSIADDGTYVFVQNFGKVDHRYPGLSPFNPEKLKSYVDDNFLFDPAHEDTRQPRMYLLGSVSLSDEQVRRLQK